MVTACSFCGRPDQVAAGGGAPAGRAGTEAQSWTSKGAKKGYTPVATGSMRIPAVGEAKLISALILFPGRRLFGMVEALQQFFQSIQLILKSTEFRLLKTQLLLRLD